MSESAPSPEAVKSEIAREIVRVHEDSYGESATNVEVALHEGFVAVVMDVVLNRAEQTLVGAGNEDSVQTTREAFQGAIAPTFTAIVERASGRRVTGFASRTIVAPQKSWSVEIFRLGDEAQPSA